MTTDIEQILDGWLAEGTDILPDRSVEAVLRTVEHTSQRGAWRVPWGTIPRSRAYRFAVVASVAIVAVATVGGLSLWLGGGRSLVGTPHFTQSPEPSLSPSESPPGAATLAGRIAFVLDGGRSSNDIWVMNADGSSPRLLTTSLGPEGNPAWSPDAQRIAFTVGDAAAQVWVMNADGSSPQQVTHNDFPAGRPTWSPDGTEIAFALNDGMPSGADHGGLYVARADGSVQRRITADSNDRSPAWSPQGDRIAFVNGDAIYTVRPDGSDRTLFARHAAGTDGLELSARDPSWSPDGTRIAVSFGNNDGNSSIWLEDAHGEQRLTDELSVSGLPTWSPDGEWLAFVMFGSRPPYGSIYVVSTDGSRLLDILPEGGDDRTPFGVSGRYSGPAWTTP